MKGVAGEQGVRLRVDTLEGFMEAYGDAKSLIIVLVAHLSGRQRMDVVEVFTETTAEVKMSFGKFSSDRYSLRGLHSPTHRHVTYITHPEISNPEGCRLKQHMVAELYCQWHNFIQYVAHSTASNRGSLFLLFRCKRASMHRRTPKSTSVCEYLHEVCTCDLQVCRYSVRSVGLA